MKTGTRLIAITGVFLVCRFFPVERARALGPFYESLALARWYAEEHVLLCLIPALFIAGAIGVFLRRESVLRYLGAEAPKGVAYPVAALSGSVLAVCSCTILPLFAGIYRRGAGLGPATAFLYAGPAINVLAIILTARILGPEIGLARAAGAILFAIVIGLLMHALFLRSESSRATPAPIAGGGTPGGERALWQDTLFFLALVGILVFANWGRPTGDGDSLWGVVYRIRWVITAVLSAALALFLYRWFRRDELRRWVVETGELAGQILPLLFGGVLVAGLLLGGPGGGAGILPRHWIEGVVGGNSPATNLFAAVAGAFMYFATLTEVPILEGLRGAGMGDGPSLALLLAGPAISLPNMLVIRSVLGTRRTAAYIGFVVILSAIGGIIYGRLAS